jgi:hypothetical protein
MAGTSLLLSSMIRGEYAINPFVCGAFKSISVIEEMARLTGVEPVIF